MPASEAPKSNTPRLKAGDLAPEFLCTDIHGQEISLQALRGKPLFLSFHRFAKCPFCNLRIHQLIERYPQFASHGLHTIAVFESSPDNVRDGVGAQKPPFSLVADPQKQLYSLYGVERSVLGLAKGMLHRLAVARESIALGLVRPIPRDGSTLRIPADFLIAPNGQIFDAYYGNDIGDYLPFDHIEAFLKTHGRRTPSTFPAPPQPL